MAALADDYPDRRQQCVDVLCGYLRLPWDPEADDLAATSTTVSRTGPDGATTAVTTTPARRPHDAEVRATVLAVIAAHTRQPPGPGDSWSWTPLDFNLTGAHLRDLDLAGCRFDGRLLFDGAVFSGTRTTFQRARFSLTGRRITHDRVVVSFRGATFNATETSFEAAVFGPAPSSDQQLSFARASFVGGVRLGSAALPKQAFRMFSGITVPGRLMLPADVDQRHLPHLGSSTPTPAQVRIGATWYELDPPTSRRGSS